MPLNTRSRNGKQRPRRLLDLPYEIREMIYLHALVPIPPRIHPPQGVIRLFSLVPSFNQGEPMTIPAIFLVSKQTHTETTPLFFSRTALVFRMRQLSTPLSQILDPIPVAAKQHIRTIDLHMGSLYRDGGLTTELTDLLQTTFPKFHSLHLTLEQVGSLDWSHLYSTRKTGRLFPITLKTLSHLPAQKLRQIRLCIDDAFERNNNLTLPCFQTFLTSLSRFPSLAEVEIYFQTMERGSIPGFQTQIFIPASAPTHPAVLDMERRVLSPYLSALETMLPQVKWFEIWRLRARMMDQTGTLPVKEEGLLDLLGGRARDIDCGAGYPVVRRLIDGRAV